MKKIKAGFVLSCIGDNRSYSLLHSRYADTYADKIAELNFNCNKIKFKRFSYLDNEISIEKKLLNDPINSKDYKMLQKKIENIQKFNVDFPDSDIVRLEQNYRSTANILNAANELIANNNGRLGKNLWTECDEGDPLSLYEAFNEQDEARFIVDRLQEWSNNGNLRKESAILYRSNAQSRELEDALLRVGMPYLIYGGHRSVSYTHLTLPTKA